MYVYQDYDNQLKNRDAIGKNLEIQKRITHLYKGISNPIAIKLKRTISEEISQNWKICFYMNIAVSVQQFMHQAPLFWSIMLLDINDTMVISSTKKNINMLLHLNLKFKLKKN